MKLISGLISLFFVFSFFFSPVFAQTNDPIPEAADTQSEENQESSGFVDVASIFWPIVPGTTVADGMFFLKQLKESLQGMFTFGNVNQARYQTELSKKRIVEANKLVDDKNYDNAIKSLQMSEDNRTEAIEFKRKATEAQEETSELVNSMVDAFEKEEQVLQYFSVAMPGEQKAAIDEQLEKIKLQISEAK